ncbi:MAG: hypothetical protein KKB50_06010 [Planctomycetes bacterium]|nr:hypothetical protein [Planctomycetota bacterium]
MPNDGESNEVYSLRPIEDELGPQPSAAERTTPPKGDPEQAARCPQCGYNLYGLRKLRCPECGLQPNPEDLFVSEDELRLRRVARWERAWTAIGVVLLCTGFAFVLASALQGRTGARGYVFCFTAPLLAMTVLLLAYHYYTSTTIHRLLVLFGVIWLLHGMLLLHLA